ncbi:hypothetical protein VNO77_18727 [Canavalia gladiata]|uniref:Uncharacterized protein n=1 Tax=Canavalia gladiata TaxID=3824 RepID=A0AAN9LLC1_CANGL
MAVFLVVRELWGQGMCNFVAKYIDRKIPSQSLSLVVFQKVLKKPQEQEQPTRLEHDDRAKEVEQDQRHC